MIELELELELELGSDSAYLKRQYFANNCKVSIFPAYDRYSQPADPGRFESFVALKIVSNRWLLSGANRNLDTCYGE